MADTFSHRKDVTLYEIIDPVPQIAKKNLNFAKDNLHKVCPLVETVWRYTDGRSTNWSMTYWIQSLIDSDIKTSVSTLIEMIEKDQNRDWRVEAGTEYLCKKLLNEKIDPKIIADLYESINQSKNTRIDVSIGLKITDTLLLAKETKRAERLFEHICRSLYFVSILKYVSDKENYTKIINFSKESSLPIRIQYRTNFLRVTKKQKDSIAHSVPKDKIPQIKFSGLSFEGVSKLIESNPPRHFLHSKNAKRMGLALVKLSKKNQKSTQELLLPIIRKGLYSEIEIKGLIKIAEVLKTNKETELSAFVMMLGFVYIRGGNGWHSLADEKYNFLGINALNLSKKIAEETLANEMSYLFSTSTYFTGPTRHLIGLFTSTSRIQLAQNIWKEAYKVIKLRLPTHPELKKVLREETPSLEYSRRKSIQHMTKKLIKARGGITN